MATPDTSSSIGVSQINTEVGRAAATPATDLNFLNGYLKPTGTSPLNTGGVVSTPSPVRQGNPQTLGYYRGGLTYYKQNTNGNCNNTNNGVANDCNSGDATQDCPNCKNCGAINCANCDTQKWLQTGNCENATTPVYNCTRDTACYKQACSTACACGKIICTKLFDLGLMKKTIFEADQAFGEKLLETRPDIYNGYRAWAEIVVDWMDGKGPKMMPWMSDEEFSIAAKKWSISWAYDIATPWAEEMAYLMGEKETGSLTGKMMFAFGIPICKVVGVWKRWFGPSKKEPGFMKGAALVIIFVMFKLIAELGRFIERFIPNKKVA